MTYFEFINFVKENDCVAYLTFRPAPEYVEVLAELGVDYAILPGSETDDLTEDRVYIVPKPNHPLKVPSIGALIEYPNFLVTLNKNMPNIF